MSYAAVASQNIPPLSEQPHPDPALLSIGTSMAPGPVADDSAKVNVVPTDFKEHPVTSTSEYAEYVDIASLSRGESRRPKDEEKPAEAEAGGYYLWKRLKSSVPRPAVVGGLLGVVNVGLIAGAAYVFYSEPQLRRDCRALSVAVTSSLALVGAEGYLAESYLRASVEQAAQYKAGGSSFINHRRAERMLRQSVLCSLVGMINISILGAVGYSAFKDRQLQRWDSRVVSSVSIGLLALWGSQGYLISHLNMCQ
ncbi:hypothetical protein K488DRAFT_90656 [Vararia minispora EC-137]|uniref:Uncharacterized protein n=1 Tax=Vararia minispora EC-137 TaxID=1314806 RepID=A0ACB8Q7E0_9AGAM|nr:hypothetical protein K488DRAFT_90656 [Vararia minispora EC-137]